MYKSKKKILVDLGIIFLFLPLSFPLYMVFGDYINNNPNFNSILLASILQFWGGGLGVFVVMFIRKESFSEYGIKAGNLKKSLFIGLIFVLIMVLLKSINEGEFLYFPMRNHTAMEYSLRQIFPLNFLGAFITLMGWGVVEGIYYVVIVKKIDDLFKQTKLLFSLAPIIFYLFNFTIHFCIRVFVEQRTYNISIIGVFLGLMLAYAMFVPRKVTGNSWGSLIYQTMQNGLGKI